MSTFIGVLLDVSGSMKSSIGGGVEEEGGTWSQSIFTVIDDLVKHDVTRDNQVFAGGVGASKDEEIFDVIGTLKDMQEITRNTSPANHMTIEDIFRLLERNGATTIRKWATHDVVSLAVTESKANLILEKLRFDQDFRKTFVYELLPKSCRDWGDDAISSGLQSLFSSAVSTFRQASVEEIKEVADGAMKMIPDSYTVIKALDNQSIYSVQEAARVIRGCVDEEELTKERAKQLLEIVEPFIYGGTPLYSALEKASFLISRSLNSYPNHKRLLFVLSDGEPGDSGDLESIKSQLKALDVTVVGCYISRSSNVEPRRLHNVKGQDWEKGAEFLFDLSSIIPTNMVTRAIFLKHGWTIDITNNETNLFMHVNHPDHLKDACALARNVVCSQDALTDLLTSVSLDVYISCKNSEIEAHEQVGGTCYANASAAVLHLAMKRILGRDGGYPEFEDIRDDLINNHGVEGANTFRVLQEVCPVYRLHCKEVDVAGAMKAIVEKRPVVAKFRLTNAEWEIFESFYEDHPTGVMTKETLDIRKRRTYAGTRGHAVVLTSFNSECLRLMNSWGEEWADMGFFRVETADVLGLEFIDVFWTSNDLSGIEKSYYRIHGTEIADVLMTHLTALQIAEFSCPLCGSRSKVTEFEGTLIRAVCPKCRGRFSCQDGEGNILALNMYLTSLAR